MKTYNIIEAAVILKMHTQTLRERAAAGKIPRACKPARAWVFPEDGLQEYLDSICHSIASARSTTSTSSHRAVGLEEVLGLPTSKRRTPTISA